MKKFLRQIWELYKPFRLIMLGLFGFVFAGQAVSLSLPFVQGKVIDGMVQQHPIRDVLILVVAALSLNLLKLLVNYLREKYELHYIDFEVSKHTNHVTMEKLFGFSIGQHVSENSGIKQSIISRGQNSLSTLVFSVLYNVLPMLVEIILLVGVLIYFSPPLGFIVLAGVTGYVSLVLHSNLRFRKDFKKSEIMQIRNAKFQGEILRNMEMVLANAQQDKAVKECDENLTNVSGFIRNVWLRFIVFSYGRHAMIATFNTSVMATGIFLVYNGTHTVGELVTYLSWSGAAFGHIISTGQLHRQLIQAHSSVKKYFEMLSIEPDVKVIPNPVKPEKFDGKIEFRNVTLSYKGRDIPESYNQDEDEEELGDKETIAEKKEITPALHDVSFVIDAGQTVAFVGESGAGKSTVLYALLRAQDPQEGQIVIDGNDLRVLDLTKYRESVGVVDQQVPLFDRSLRYNILYSINGREAHYTKEMMDNLAEMSCINRFFDRLENGYDTLIGERGIKLSGGERQRVGIARALAKEPDILIFDEATSNLDSGNESLIRESIEKVSKGRTTIIIAHRFSTIRNVDKIFVFDKGRIVGEGTHDELASSCEYYQRLVKNQK